MSFFKKMTKEFEDLKSTFSKSDEKKEEAHGDTHQGDAYQRWPPPAQQHGQAPYEQGSHYTSLPPAAGPPISDQSLPPGWIKQWDQNSQRWYFVEQVSGRTQWEPPSVMSQNYGGHSAYTPPHEGSRGMYPAPHGGSHDTYPPPHGGQYDPHHDSAKKDKGMNPMGAAAGGLAVGAVGGALVGHAMGDDSDSDHGGQQYATAPPAASYGQQPMQQQQAYPTDPPLEGELPDETRSGSSVSGSDKEDVEEARDDYQEAMREGDHSDIEEAREDYEEELEETYD